MNRPARLTALTLAIGLGLPTGTAIAQYTSLPFIFTPNQDPQDSSIRLISVMLRGDYRLTDSNAGEFTPIAGTLVLNYGRFGFSAGAGVLHDSELDYELTLGASAGFDFYFVRPILPTITLQVAVGYTGVSDASGSLERYDIPLGVGLSWPFGPPNPPINFELWFAPRVHLRTLEGSVLGNDETETDFGYGLSAGLNVMHVPVSFPINFGVQVALEELRIDDPLGSGKRWEFTLSAGIHVRWYTYVER
jgi:hypothetical protein